MSVQLPYPNISETDTAWQCEQNDRALADALALRPEISIVTVNYTADGATTGTIRIGAEFAPAGVMLIRTVQRSDPTTVIAPISPGRLLFTGSEIQLPEPAGLTAGTIYTMTFMLIGRQ